MEFKAEHFRMNYEQDRHLIDRKAVNNQPRIGLNLAFCHKPK